MDKVQRCEDELKELEYRLRCDKDNKKGKNHINKLEQMVAASESKLEEAEFDLTESKDMLDLAKENLAEAKSNLSETLAEMVEKVNADALAEVLSNEGKRYLDLVGVEPRSMAKKQKDSLTPIMYHTW